nr:retrovirus-related Pol polyprotein from transposon TNT 1-94 [Tanacetum cinerariifolium]
MLQADYDLKATNIILQGLATDVYSLVNHHKVSKDIWDIVKLLMHGTSLSKHERKRKLYDEFDKFSHMKGETLHQYYLRFAQLINDLSIIQMKMQPVQVNTKFSNSLPPEQGLVVLTFLPGDDPIACMNKGMEFLVTVHQVQRRQTQNVVSLGSQGNALGLYGNTSSQAKVIKCYNCQDPRGTYDQVSQTTTHNVAFQTDDLDVYDSECDDISSAKVVFTANLSSCDSYVLSEIDEIVVIHELIKNAPKQKLMLLDSAAERRLMLLRQDKTVNDKCCC